jgi:diguanylate cyclase (GGDEF)-like protein
VATEAERMLELMRVMPGPCALVDAGIVAAANDEAATLLGAPVSRLIGLPLADLVLLEHQRRVSTLLGGSAGDLTRVEVRLAGDLQAVELQARRVTGPLALVALRSMAREIELSAAAGGSLTHDQVSGLPNRYYLLAELHARLRAPIIRPLACLAVWVDDLGVLGAERGPRAAERVLSQVGERIHRRLRAPDLLGRFDDHGFLVLLASDMDADSLASVALRLRNEIAFPVEHENALLSFTASMAAVPFTGDRPSLERVVGRLEEVARRAEATGGALLDIVEL